MIPLKSERLLIRNFREEDWRDLHKLIRRYQASEYAQYDHPWPTGEAEIQGIAAWFAEGEDYLAVCLNPGGELIGFLAIEPRQDTSGPARNLGYVFHPDFHGQGYASEACRLVLDYVFHQLGVERILTGTHPANTASVQLLERLGLHRLGDDQYTLTREAWLESNPLK